MDAKVEEAPPPVLYKFSTAPNALNILETLRLKTAAPDQLNDPFEFLPADHALEATDSDVEEWLADPSFQKFHEETLSHDPRLRLLSKERLKQLLKEALSENQPGFINGQPENAAKVIRIISYSATAENILLWSHYADQHRGLGIGFCTQHQTFKSRPPEKVNYESERVILDSRRPHSTDETNDAHKLVYTKSPDWSYEQEWRQLWQIPHLDENQMLHLDEANIKKILIGWKTPRPIKEKLLKLCEKFLKAQILEARPDPLLYKLTFSPIN